MLSASDKLRQLIVFKAIGERHDTVAAIDEAWDRADEDMVLGDAMDEIRGGTHKTGLESPGDRNYETEAVATQMLDDSGVGWCHYYGGGKHGEPEHVPWIEDAYDLDRPKEVTVTKLVFQKPKKKRKS